MEILIWGLNVVKTLHILHVYVSWGTKMWHRAHIDYCNTLPHPSSVDVVGHLETCFKRSNERCYIKSFTIMSFIYVKTHMTKLYQKTQMKIKHECKWMTYIIYSQSFHESCGSTSTCPSVEWLHVLHESHKRWRPRTSSQERIPRLLVELTQQYSENEV